MMIITKNIRKILLIIVALAILFTIANIAIHFATTGSLTIESEKNNTITVNPTSGKSTNIPIKKSVGKLSVRLKKGDYYINVSSDNGSIYKLVKVENMKNKKETISVKPPLKSELVISAQSWSIAADEKQLNYLSASGINYRINSDNMVTPTSNIIFNEIKWANANYGIARDIDGNFYTLKNNQISKQVLPLDITNVANGNYGMNISKKGNIYVWSDTKVYKSTDGISFDIFYHSDNYQIHDVMPSANNVAVITSSQTNDDLKSRVADKEYIVTMLKTDGSIISKANEELYGSAISPNGDYFAFTNDEGTEIFNSKLENIVKPPNTNVNNLTWVNDHLLIYSVEDKIYQFDTNNPGAVLLTTDLLGGSIVHILVNDSRDTLFYSSQDSQDKSIISKVSLVNKPASADVAYLAYSLPTNLGNCSVIYINFTKPTIQMGIATDAFKSSCQQKTKDYLLKGGVKIDDYTNYYSLELNDD